MSNLSKTKISGKIIEDAIRHIQQWMSNNPKYSEEFRSKAKYKDELYRVLLKYKMSKARK